MLSSTASVIGMGGILQIEEIDGLIEIKLRKDR